MGISIEESRRPLIAMRFDGEMSDALVQAHVEAVRGVLDRGERFALIRDPSRVSGPPSALQRRIMAQHFREDRLRLARLWVGAAFLIPSSSLVRGALTAILWIQPLPHPHTVVSNFESAEAWCRARLEDAGLTVPAVSERRNGRGSGQLAP